MKRIIVLQHQTSTPIHEKQILTSPISPLSNNNSHSPKIRSINSDLEKSLMVASNTSLNSSGLGLGLNFGSGNNNNNSNSSINSSKSPSRSNSLGAIISLGGGSNTNSKANSPLNTPPIPSSPSVTNPQDKMKELPHPLYNVDPLSSP